MVEYSPCLCDVLRSIPGTAKVKKKIIAWDICNYQTLLLLFEVIILDIYTQITIYTLSLLYNKECRVKNVILRMFKESDYLTFLCDFNYIGNKQIVVYILMQIPLIVL